MRSRCRQVLFGLPEQKIAAAWLAAQGVAKPALELSLAGGAPLAVLARSETGSGKVVEDVLGPLQKTVEPLALASLWDGQLRSNSTLTLETLVDTLQRWVYDLIRVRMSVAPKYLVDQTPALSRVAQDADLSRLTKCYDDLLKIRTVTGHPLNPQLFLEDLASRYAAAVAGARP